MALVRLPDVAAARRRLAGRLTGSDARTRSPAREGRPDQPAAEWQADRSAVGWQADRSAVDAVLRSVDPPDPQDACAALTLVADLRADLDRAEQRLIERARAGGASWRDIAGALGLRSRQAAEQRWLRSRAAATRDPAAVRRRRQRQRSVDDVAGRDIVELRAEAAKLADRLAAVPGGRGAAGNRVDLARRTLSAAADAPPGAMFDLVRLGVQDLLAVPPTHLGQPVIDALSRVSARVEAAGPARDAAPDLPRNMSGIDSRRG